MSIFLKSNFKVAKYCAAMDRIYCMNLSAPFLCQFFKDQVNQPINQSINQLPTFQTQSELTKSRHGITACDLDKLLLLLLYFIFSIPFILSVWKTFYLIKIILNTYHKSINLSFFCGFVVFSSWTFVDFLVIYRGFSCNKS